MQWTTHHEGIQSQVSSYFYEPAATLIDPRVPEGGLELFEGRRPPERIVLTCRHHYRHSDRFVEAFGCSVHGPESGLHEFGDGVEVQGFRPGQVLAPGVEALEMGTIAPDDSALYLEVEGGALAFADGLVHIGPEIGFVPDFLMGDDPEAVKRGVVESLTQLLDRRADTLLFAHGDPVVRGGREALERFLEGQAA